MKFRIILICLLSNICFGELACETDFTRQDLTAEERDELVSMANQKPFEEIVPFILDVYTEYTPDPFVGINGDDWNSDRLHAPFKTYVMARVVWNHHVNTKQTSEKTELLLKLLKETSNPSKKATIIYALRCYQWDSTAETCLSELAKNRAEYLSVQTVAVDTLLRKCDDVNIYMPTALEIILLHKKHEYSSAFNKICNNDLSSMNSANRNQFLATGFWILSELPEKDLQNGYFVARKLGRVLGVEDVFVPDQHSPEYKGDYGLKDEFFADTVRNALAWYADNKDALQKDCQQEWFVKIPVYTPTVAKPRNPWEDFDLGQVLRNVNQVENVSTNQVQIMGEIHRFPQEYDKDTGARIPPVVNQTNSSDQVSGSTVVDYVHDTGPEQMVHTIIQMGRFYVSGSKDVTLSVVDYESLQKMDPSMTKDKFYATLKSVDSEDIVLSKVEEPPYSTVIEMTKPKGIRFYFEKQRSDRPSPHDPPYNEEWDYILIGLKVMDSTDIAEKPKEIVNHGMDNPQ